MLFLFSYVCFCFFAHFGLTVKKNLDLFNMRRLKIKKKKKKENLSKDTTGV